jgi:hypothetical protein
MSTAATAPSVATSDSSICQPFVVLVIAIFVVLSLTCAVLSDGFVAADACTHYLFARYAFADPVNLVDVWARPLCTLLYALPARLPGRLGVQVTSIAVAVGCALVAGAIAKGQGHRRPELAVLFTVGAPLFFLYSFAEMTELPFALVLGGALLAYQRRQFALLALFAALLPTARPEGFGFVLLAGAAIVAHRRWIALPILLLPLVAWDVAGWLLTARQGHWWMWLIHAWPWSPENAYGRGSIFTFVAALPLVVPPLLLPAMIAGLWRGALSFPLSRGDRRKEGICEFLIAAIPLSVLILHSLLRWSGKFGTLGEPRYLLITAPLWGVLCARGWENIFDRLQWRHVLAFALPAVCLPAVVNLFYPVVPVHATNDWQTARRFAEIYRGSSLHERYPHVIASHVGIYYYLGIDPTSHGREDSFNQAVIEHPPAGAILVWDPVFSASNANTEDTSTLDAIRSAGWSEDYEVSDQLGDHWHVFERKAPARRVEALPAIWMTGKNQPLF